MDIIAASYKISSATYKQCPAADRPEYAFIGRSNVGKSSLINMITNKTALAKTSANPGKTQLINHFDITSASQSGKTRFNWYLVDLPGYGYAKISQKTRNNWENMIETYIRKRENLGNLFVLIDSRHEPQALDIEFIERLGEWGVPFSVVFTKADKNKPGATQRNVKAFLDRLLTQWEQLPTHFVSSAVDRTGREDLLDFIQSLNAEYKSIQGR